LSDAEDISDDDDGEGLCSSSYVASVRPGIVHWLDKGTSGLLVVAKVTSPPFNNLSGFNVKFAVKIYEIVSLIL
jgi:23S rRNA-/tRNA-specific pseudouridylate synthase